MCYKKWNQVTLSKSHEISKEIRLCVSYQIFSTNQAYACVKYIDLSIIPFTVMKHLKDEVLLKVT